MQLVLLFFIRAALRSLAYLGGVIGRWQVDSDESVKDNPLSNSLPRVRSEHRNQLTRLSEPTEKQTPPPRHIRARNSLMTYCKEVRRIKNAANRSFRTIQEFWARPDTTALDPSRETIFLVVTHWQAVRIFLLSDFYNFLSSKYNVVVFSPYAYLDSFVSEYSRANVHILPWFPTLRPRFERVFLYYLMRKSGSGTHTRWLRNLEERAKTNADARIVRNVSYQKVSNFLGTLLGRRGLMTLYQSYVVGLVPKYFIHSLFDHYRPALVMSTAAHLPEAWPLTYFARQRGIKTVTNILSWDNTTTKPAVDPACDYTAVWSDEMAGEFARHYPFIKTQLYVTGTPLFDMYSDKCLLESREAFLKSVGLRPDLPYVLYTTNTPSATTDEHIIVKQYWDRLGKSRLAGSIGLLVRLHPKQKPGPYRSLLELEGVAITMAGTPHVSGQDRWIPTQADMHLLLNSMVHAGVSVNIASTMTLESFALDIPTINVALRSSEDVKNPTVMWSFDMFHTSDHYRAILENGAVDLARSIDELVAMTVKALENGHERKAAMQATLELKAAYCGASARRFLEFIDGILDPNSLVALPDRSTMDPQGSEARVPQTNAAE